MSPPHLSRRSMRGAHSSTPTRSCERHESLPLRSALRTARAVLSARRRRHDLTVGGPICRRCPTRARRRPPAGSAPSPRPRPSRRRGCPRRLFGGPAVGERPALAQPRFSLLFTPRIRLCGSLGAHERARACYTRRAMQQHAWHSMRHACRNEVLLGAVLGHLVSHPRISATYMCDDISHISEQK